MDADKHGHKAAYRYFESMPPGYRKAILLGLATAKRPETRAARFSKLLTAVQQASA